MNAQTILELQVTLLDRIHPLSREQTACNLHAHKGGVKAPFWLQRSQQLGRQLAAQKRLLRRNQLRLEALLQRLPQGPEAQVLGLRHLSLMSYAQISEALSYSERHIHRLHLQGLRQLQELLEGR